MIKFFLDGLAIMFFALILMVLFNYVIEQNTTQEQLMTNLEETGEWNGCAHRALVPFSCWNQTHTCAIYPITDTKYTMDCKLYHRTTLKEVKPCQSC